MARATELLWTADRPPGEVRAWARRVIVPALRSYGFRVERESAASMLLIRRRSAWWLLPFGVLAFLFSPDRKERVALGFSESDPGHGRLTVLGEVPSPVRAILLQLPGCREVPEAD